MRRPHLWSQRPADANHHLASWISTRISVSPPHGPLRRSGESMTSREILDALIRMGLPQHRRSRCVRCR